MDFVTQTFIHTPWWVYVLFIYLVFIGIKAMKAGSVSIYKLIALPILFLILSLHTLYVEMALNIGIVFAWVLGMIVGILAGIWHSKSHYIGIDKHKMVVKVKGSSLTLIIILLIFISKYYFGYMGATHPEELHNLRFVSVMLFCYGLATGLFCGRVGYFFVKLKK